MVHSAVIGKGFALRYYNTDLPYFSVKCKMVSAKADRTPTGQFAHGNGGRPKGSKNKQRTYTKSEFSASVTKAAKVRLESLMDMALEVIKKQLEEGDTRTAIWVIDRCLPPTQHRLSEAIPNADLSSLEGIISAAKMTSEMALGGRVGLAEASRILTILINTASLLGYRRIDELRQMIEEFESRNKPGATSLELPMWGRLQERSKATS